MTETLAATRCRPAVGDYCVWVACICENAQSTTKRREKSRVLSSGQIDHEPQNLLHTLECLSSHFVHSLFKND